MNWVNDGVISGLTSINSQQTHLVINSCNNVLVRNVKLIAPDQSPNTDGIHVQGSNAVTITGATLRTGDDCVSIGPATNNLLITNIKCGPGHGVRYINIFIYIYPFFFFSKIYIYILRTRLSAHMHTLINSYI